MLGIKEKLRQFETLRHSEFQYAAAQEIDPALIDAVWASNRYGRFILREKRYDDSFFYGACRMGEFFDLPNLVFMQAGGDAKFQNISPADVLLFDAETTGLSGGAGTCAFLLGIGFIENQKLVVRQYFMPEFDCEGAMLFALLEEFDKRHCLISYNGKSYDLPLLKSRFVLNRQTPQFDNHLHIDLLYLVRRLWKNALPSCALTEVEKSAVGFQRIGDIPGSDIPAAYFRFLKNSDLHGITPIFKHNVQDILAMTALMVQVHKLFSSGSTPITPDNTWLFRILCQIGMGEEALAKTIDTSTGRDPNAAVRLWMEQARFLKKCRRYPEAAAIWHRLTVSSELVEEAYEELAKYYEHIVKDCASALAALLKYEKRVEMRNALRQTDNAPLTDPWQKRKKRLQRKLNHPATGKFARQLDAQN